jgi:hypothetical protein
MATVGLSLKLGYRDTCVMDGRTELGNPLGYQIRGVALWPDSWPSALKDLRPLHERILQVTLEIVILQSVTGGDARVQLIQLSVVTVIMLRCPRMLES